MLVVSIAFRICIELDGIHDAIDFGNTSTEIALTLYSVHTQESGRFVKGGNSSKDKIAMSKLYSTIRFLPSL